VWGPAEDPGRTASVLSGAQAAAAALAEGGEAAAVLLVEAGPGAAGLERSVKEVRAKKPLGVLVLAHPGLGPEAWKAMRSLRAPCFVLESVAPDLLENDRGNVWHLAPSPAAQAVAAADAMLAPLAARRVVVVHEDTPHGRDLATAFARNLSQGIALAGVEAWPEGGGAADAERLEGYEADWAYAALSGRHALAYARALEARGKERRTLFADACRSQAILAAAPKALEGSVFLDDPDPELTGRAGEGLVEALERAGHEADALSARAFEAARRILVVNARTGEDGAGLAKALAEEDPGAGPLGPLAFEPYRASRFPPTTLWRSAGQRLEPWPVGLLPTPGCGPPLGFRRPAPGPLAERGKLGVLTYGEADKRTIEQDLLELGLSTGGAHPDLDARLRDEVLGRAVRIAYRLFGREADGTPIAGHSFGMVFAEGDAVPEDVPRHRVWLAIVAGDHPDAGGQVIGSGLVAVYATFLKRTMYLSRRLDPPVSASDRPLLDGTYRWGRDRALHRRIDEIRCLLDGFASAVGLTLAHEYGHLAGCGHDTEHPTSIMNVVAGAGASWEEAVWIPSHLDLLTTALGREGVTR
jgi:ABC-type branched-subunit amino acid transport system substrate-binding protein